ncbi:MAG: hypothetical protein ACRDKI_04585 [Solirubrobacterales bacterium]
MSTSGERPGQVWSTAPPGASRGKKEVLIAGGPAPNDSGVTRRKHIRGVLFSRGYVWTLALIGGGGFLAGAATGGPVVAAAVPTAVLVTGFVMAVRKANSLAARDFFYGFALNHGFTYTPKLTLLEATPLLGAGERRSCKHYMEGPLGDIEGISAGLSLYVYETLEERRGRRDSHVVNVYSPHNFTICVAELQRAITTFPGVFLRQRGGLFGGDDWLDVSGLKTVELESSSLASNYKLKVRNNQDMSRLLQLFEPSFQVWLSELPFQIYFEYSGGALVTYVPKHLSDATSLEILYETTARIAKRILKEGEPLHAVAAAQPHYGTRPFPPPPEATKPLIHGVPVSVPPPPPPTGGPPRSVPPPAN